jgi:hypothetical protein
MSVLRRTAAVSVPTISVVGLVAGGLIATTSPAGAAPEWTNERVLDCSGTMVDTFLTPAGFGTPFHVAGSTDVIVPVHVEVVFPGQTEPVTTFDVPGFSRNAVGTVECSYTDPAGLFVTFIGVRT